MQVFNLLRIFYTDQKQIFFSPEVYKYLLQKSFLILPSEVMQVSKD